MSHRLIEAASEIAEMVTAGEETMSPDDDADDADSAAGHVKE